MALTSAHRIVSRTAGGHDMVAGSLRPQNVIEAPAGVAPAACVTTDNGDGTVTMAAGGHSVTFTGSIDALPSLAASDGAGGYLGNDSGPDAGNDSGPDAGNGGGAHEDADYAPDGLVLMPGATAEAQFGGADDDVLVGGDTGDALIGKGGADVVLGNGGNDVAIGGAGRDVLLGGVGRAHFIAQDGDGADLIFGGEGADLIDLSAVTSGAMTDLGTYTPIGSLRIGGVTDHLMGIEDAIGSQGADTIKAGLAINVMTGCDGKDVFLLAPAGTAHGDVITDFRVHDRIDLSGIDAMFGANGNQAFTLAHQGSTAAGGLVIHEIATSEGGDTIIDGFTDDDADADFSITLRGASSGA